MHVSEVKRRFIPINRQKARLNCPSIHFVSRCNFRSAATYVLRYFGHTSVMPVFERNGTSRYWIRTKIAFSVIVWVSEVKRRFILIHRQKARLNCPLIHFVSKCNFRSAATYVISSSGHTSVCRSMNGTIHLGYGLEQWSRFPYMFEFEMHK